MTGGGIAGTPAGPAWADASGGWPHLPKAPAAEALIDFRVRLPLETALSTFEAFGAAIHEDYPEKQERVRFEFKGMLPAGGAGAGELSSSTHPDGLIFRSRDGLQVVQARLEGFTFSRLRPYEDWTRLKSEARRLWDIYREVARPERVTRIGVRYINRIVFPLPVDFADYLRTMPTVAPSLPQELQELFLRLVVPFPQHEARCIVTQVLQPLDDDAGVPYIFDIDAFREGAWDVQAEEVWLAAEGLRAVKNEVFFGSLTDKALELFR